MSRPEQLALLDDPIDARFRAYHHRNPEVYRELRRLAFEWLAAGGRRCSIAMLFEVARWQRGVRADDDADPFALNNDYRSRYARLLMASEPELDGMFAVRRTRAERQSIAVHHDHGRTDR